MKKNFFLVFLALLMFMPEAFCQHKLLILDMVHNNPGEPLTVTSFRDPQKIAKYGYNGMVINEFRPVSCAVTYDSLNRNIFPKGSESRKWVDSMTIVIRHQIDSCHKAGLKIFYFTDIIVVPKRLKELYRDQICDSNGLISFEKPMTEKIHRIMLDEIFERFPGLDGLVIRTGETYLQNVPYHTGNGPIPRDESSWTHNKTLLTDGGEDIHIKLINLLRDEVCVKYKKILIYRTWDFGFFHTQPQYYLNVTNRVKPHPNLYFAIKHTQGDYHRTIKFNPTLGIGNHKQIVEVECQREYEGKGAFPDYVINGLINGFEEYANDKSPKSLNELKSNKNFAGIWSWSRGGGWVGPYIKNELWCDLNAYVVSHWAADTTQSEEKIFNGYATNVLGLKGKNVAEFRKLCLLSADAVIRGHESLLFPVDPWWTRDEFLGGLNELKSTFDTIISQHLVKEALQEKKLCVSQWKQIYNLAGSIECPDLTTKNYIMVSSEYGLILHSIIEKGWTILLKGRMGDISGKYDKSGIRKAIRAYDNLWLKFENLSKREEQCATLYKPYSFNNISPTYHGVDGMKYWVDHYRSLVK